MVERPYTSTILKYVTLGEALYYFATLLLSALWTSLSYGAIFAAIAHLYRGLRRAAERIVAPRYFNAFFCGGVFGLALFTIQLSTIEKTLIQITILRNPLFIALQQLLMAPTIPLERLKYSVFHPLASGDLTHLGGPYYLTLLLYVLYVSLSYGAIFTAIVYIFKVFKRRLKIPFRLRMEASKGAPKALHGPGVDQSCPSQGGVRMEESPFIESMLGFIGRFLVDRRGRVVVSVLLGALGRFGLMRRPFMFITSLIGFSRIPLYVLEFLYDEVRTFTQDELLIVCYYPCLREGLVDVLLFAIIIYPILTLFVRVLSRVHEEGKRREDEGNL